ncbi:hypothetical protein JCM11251_003691 [Rhodosporidiobolus azoricus]
MGAFAGTGGDSPGGSGGGHGGAGFFASNRLGTGSNGTTSTAATQQAFLPPLAPARSNSNGAGQKRSGATLLSDEETSENGSMNGSFTAHLGGGGGFGSQGGVPAANLPPLPGSALANLPPLAPAPAASTSSSAGGGGGTPRPGRGVSRTPSVGGPSGPSAKGKGKAKDGEKGPAKKVDGPAGTGKKPGKRGQQVGADGKPLPKKKKAGRACAACQKAHLTCDDSRPCARCVKKGCPDECIDGARKKAKYLLEVPDELLERGRPHVPGSSAPPSAGAVADTLLFNGVDQSPSSALEPGLSLSPSIAPPPTIPPPQHQQPPQPSPVQQQPYFDFSVSTATSSAPDAAPPPQAAAYDPSSFLSFPSASASSSSAQASTDPTGGLAGVAGSTSFTSALDTTSFGSEAANLEYAILSSMLNGNGFALDTPLAGPSTSTPNGLVAMSGGVGSGGLGGGPAMKNGVDSDPMLLDPTSGATPSNANGNGAPAAGGGGGGFGDSPAAASATGSQSGVAGLLTAEEAYRSVTKPYPYAQSYHYLVKHLKERFEKNDILRIIRALATFRPSLIALQMPLTEEDETFVERTFQRTLVELNKLISFSGTPTVVWRRTGEICLVGTEFCLLTGWKREELVGKKYIFELFDTSSVVEYYENFAKHAFESTATSITMQAVVLGPDGRPVPCAFCFSVRRDLFSCPFLVIGSFLPVLV